MAEPNPYAGDPYERLGIDPDAPSTEVKVAAANAKRKFNPDRAAPGSKSEVRELLYRIRDAEEAIINDEDPEFGPKPRPDGVSLKIEVETTEVLIGNPVRFLVTDSDDAPIKDAEVVFDGEAKLTDKLGQVEFETTGLGTFEVKASKTGFDPVYEPTSMTIEVEKRMRNLSIDVTKTTVAPHTDITLFIHDDSNDPVEGVSITGDGIDKTTDRTGETVISFSSEGDFEVAAEKEDCEPDTVVFTVEKRKESLSLDYKSDSTYVGESITVSVDAGGTPDIEIKFDGKTKSLDGGGEVDFETDSVGTFEVEATAPDTETTTYVPASEEVEVAAIPLEISTEPEILPTGEAVDITVREAHTGATVEDIIVTTTDGKESTTNSGSALFEFFEAGEVTVTAGERSPEHHSASTDIQIVPDEIALTIELSREAIEPGEKIKVTVRDKDGKRVENANVELDGRTWETNGRGIVRISPETEGNHRITASKKGDATSYASAKETIRVGNPKLLRVVTNRELITSGDSVRITVKNDKTGAPLPDARIEAEHSMAGELKPQKTDEDGEVSLTIDEGGQVIITATKVIDGIEETSPETMIRVQRTETGPNEEDPRLPIERLKTVAAKLTMMISLFALIIGIGAVIVEGLAAAWLLGIAVLISVISVPLYTQIVQ